MNLLQKRQDNADLVLKGKFIRTVLNDQAESFKKAQTKIMSERGFKTQKFFSNRRFLVDDEKMTGEFMKLHRFVDMRRRQTKEGSVKKKFHPIYNRIVFGHIPNIVRQLSYGFSDAVIEDLKKLEDLS